jgi:hypothetical protein
MPGNPPIDRGKFRVVRVASGYYHTSHGHQIEAMRRVTDVESTPGWRLTYPDPDGNPDFGSNSDVEDYPSKADAVEQARIHAEESGGGTDGR